MGVPKISTYRQEYQSLSAVSYLTQVLKFAQVTSTIGTRCRLCTKAINRPPLQLRQKFGGKKAYRIILTLTCDCITLSWNPEKHRQP